MPLEPIAIIGIGCRFPGADSPSAFWELLRQGKDAITEVPKSRWDIQQFYDPDLSQPGKANTRWGGFLEAIDQFDPLFFGIAPREAPTMDPQQRLLLEVAWEAFEDAGLIPEQLRGSQTGVYIGIGTHDYSIRLWQHPVSDPYATTGTGNCIAANRISYLFDLKGPSLAVDTACSSSLVAVHLACQSLWTGESTLALAGGVNVLLLPNVTAGFSKGGFMSPSGRCKSFDASADGYVRSEGAGVVVLKPLSQAQADGDPIYAIIRATAVNQDGFSHGMAAPNPQAQMAVLREAYQRAGVNPAQVRYVEAHGTGTKMGDPVELEALGAVLAEGRLADQPCLIGSVKTNIGHSETAAGVAGLIKLALSLKFGQIPPSLHYQQPNPLLQSGTLPLQVNDRLTDWGDRPHIAGVNSFGFGGTNAHVVVESAPLGSVSSRDQVGDHAANRTGDHAEPQAVRPRQILTLSAKSEAALRSLAQRYQQLLDKQAQWSPADLADLCFSAHTKRSHFHHRLAIAATTAAELQASLAAVAAGTPATEVPNLSKGVLPQSISPVVFLCTGQGAQAVGMGRQLYDGQPVFRQAIDRCAAILEAYLDVPLLQVLYPDLVPAPTQRAAKSRTKAKHPIPATATPSLLDQTQYTQPALFALEYALYQLWRSWGVEPAAVMGHSVGEYVAACIAGVFSLEDGLKLIAARGQLMQTLPPDGAMAAVMAEESRVLDAIQPYAQAVAIAALNGPQNVVISGKRTAIDGAIADLEAAGIKATRLNVSHAFHSALMEPMLAEFRDVAAQITYAPPRLTVISNVTGEAIGEAIATPDYWAQHIRQAVRFADGITTLYRQGYRLFVELGPKPVLCSMGQACIADPHLRWLPSLRPGQPDWQPLLHSLGELYVQGVTIDWQGFNAPYSRRFVPLPTYPFQRQRFWWEPPLPQPAATPPASIPPTLDAVPPHPLLGRRLSPTETGEIRFQSVIAPQSPAYLRDHQIVAQTVFPAAGYAELMLAAGAALLPSSAIAIASLTIEKPLILSEASATLLQVVLTATDTDIYRAEILTTAVPGFNLDGGADLLPRTDPQAPWTRHAQGIVRPMDSPMPSSVDRAALQATVTQAVAIAPYYAAMRDQGLVYGAAFQGIQQLWQDPGRSLALIQLPAGLDPHPYQCHPALLDSCFQALAAAIASPQRDTCYLPIGIERLQCLGAVGDRVWCAVQPRLAITNGAAPASLQADLTLWNKDGQVVLHIDGLTLQAVSQKSLHRLFQSIPSHSSDRPDAPIDWLYQLTWQRSKRPSTPIPPGQGYWLIFADGRGLGQTLAEQLRQTLGDRVIQVFAGSGDNPLEPDSYQLDPTDPLAFQSLLGAIAASESLPCRAIIHLWSTESSAESSLDHSESNLDRAQQHSCGSVLHLLQALNQKKQGLPPLWLVTQQSQTVSEAQSSSTASLDHSDCFSSLVGASLWGLARVIRLEYPGCRCVTLDLAADALSRPTGLSEAAAILLAELGADDGEDQIAYRQRAGEPVVKSDRYLARLTKLSSVTADLQLSDPQSSNPLLDPATPQRLQLSAYGQLDHLTLAPMTRRAPAPGEVEIEVAAAGVNFRDVLNALGLLKPYLEQMGFRSAREVPFGGECAGRIVAVGAGVSGLAIGDAVIAAQAVGSISQFVTVDARFVVRCPSILTMAEAATIPTTFLTAEYGLHALAGLKSGDRVLIHAAAGGVGQAAVQLAQRAGATIFATASPAKWDALKIMGVEHVLNSRSLDFADEILRLTDGAGVDLILNSLNGDVIPKNLQCLAPDGRFVEIGKIGIWSSEQVCQSRPDVSYHAFDLLEVSQKDPALITTLLNRLMPLFQSGQLQPLPHTIFPVAEAASAFRYMAQAKHIGKVVITFPPPKAGDRPTINPTIHPDASYLITGGLGALGLQVAQRLAKRGATHLILTSRRPPSSDAQAAVQRLEQQGVQVQVVQADIADPVESDRLFSRFTAADTAIPPLRGIIHAAGVIDDGILLRQSWPQFQKVMAAKVQGAWNLHQGSRDLPLDFFVCFSSIASLLGSPGQGNYAAANAFMDALAHYRQRLGLPGLSLNWGPWGGVGMAAQLNPAEQQRFTANGITPIAIEQGLDALEHLLFTDRAQVGAFPIDWAKFTAQLPAGRSPLLTDLLSTHPSSAPQSPQSPLAELPLLRTLAAASDRPAVLQAHIRELVAKVLGFSAAEGVDPHENFADLGMDSLMAVELNNRLQSTLGCTVSQTITFDYPTVAALADHLSNHLAETLTLPEPANAESPSISADVASSVVSSPSSSAVDSSVSSAVDSSITSVDSVWDSPVDSSITSINSAVSAPGAPGATLRINPPAIAPPIPPVRSPESGLEIPPEYYQFEHMPSYLSLKHDLQRVAQMGNPFFQMHDGIATDVTHINGRELISYASYNYLGMSGDPVVSQAAQAAIAHYGTSVSASRVVAGERPIHRELEQSLARWLGTEDCIVYIGGHATNVTTIGHLMGDRDLILCDALSHNSIREGCKLSGATVLEFAHNDWRSLESLLQQHRHQYQKVLIAIEGIYSTDGDLAPLPEIVALKHHYKALLLVDEAHSIGVLGRHGGGIGEHYGIPAHDVDLWMGTLSKSFASCGGYIAGSQALVEYLKYTAPGFVFSVGMSPPNAAAALASLRLLQTQPQRVTRLRERASLFLRLAQAAGLNTGASQHSPIIPVIVGEPYKAVLLSNRMGDRGINVQPMVYPSVPFNAARLRFFLTCLHTEAQIQATIAALVDEIATLAGAPERE